MCIGASVGGAIGGASLDEARSPVLATTRVTSQQQAAWKAASPVGACAWRVFVAQQHDERVAPSRLHRYHDAIALDGSRTRASRSGMTRRNGSSILRNAARQHLHHHGEQCPRCILAACMRA